MQPTNTKIALIIGALFLGASGASNAELLTVAASAVPDVDVSPVTGFTQVSFGTGVIGNKDGQTCTMQGISEVDDADMLWNASGDQAANPNSGNVNGASLGSLGGTGACSSSDFGEVMILEIDGADSSTVSVTVADVTGTGWVYTPTAQSCVIDFDRVLNDADVCEPLDNNTVTGVGMSAAQTDGTAAAGAMEVINGAQGYADIVGKTRMILAGSITLTADIGQNFVVAENITVQVTYE